MKTVTFVLANPKTWNREVRTYVLNKDKKYEQRLVRFETKGILPGQRTTRGRTINATFTTKIKELIEALKRDSAYGKDFYMQGDADGEQKLPTLIVNEKDKEIVAVRALMQSVGLKVDENLPIDVLKKQYEIHVGALSGKKDIGAQSTATEIPHVPVNPGQEIAQAIADGKALYEEKFGEEIPEFIRANRGFLVGLIEGLYVEGFNVEDYIAEKEALLLEEEEVESTTEDNETTGDELPGDAESLFKLYFDTLGKNVPNTKKKDLGWVKGKILEAREQ